MNTHSDVCVTPTLTHPFHQQHTQTQSETRMQRTKFYPPTTHCHYVPKCQDYWGCFPETIKRLEMLEPILNLSLQVH